MAARSKQMPPGNLLLKKLAVAMKVATSAAEEEAAVIGPRDLPLEVAVEAETTEDRRTCPTESATIATRRVTSLVSVPRSRGREEAVDEEPHEKVALEVVMAKIAVNVDP